MHYPDSSATGFLKLSAVTEALGTGRRVIWTDDEETPTPDENPELYARLTAAGRALLIRPKPSRGLRSDDIAKIIDFCGDAT